MALSWNEIRIRANAFAKRWEDASNENSQSKPFLIDFFEVFGITDKRVASFEHAVKKLEKIPNLKSRGFIDLFWPGILLVEMKSRGKNLDTAFSQALDYFSGISERDLPRFVLVCDFQRFKLTDLTNQTAIEFELNELYKNVKSFGFIAGYQTQIIKPQDPINIKAAERMGKLHDALKAVGYDGHILELYLVRLLFCLFAEDTTIFEKSLFQEYIETKTQDDGSDLAHHINSLFFTLNTPENLRLKNLDEHLAAFPYINGRLFEEPLPPAQFDRKMREALLDLCALDWSLISPAIFGSLFQSIMDFDARRNLGAHYTSEENILKLIKPLFLDELWEEFHKRKKNKTKLVEFHKKLRNLTFFDPACGCGNFLVITYRELRLLEIEVLRLLHDSNQKVLDVEQLIQINVDQFYGVEVEEFPAQIAQVALWLTDHQMNMKVSDEFGNYFARIPLKSKPHIVHGNALRINWCDVLSPSNCSYILGNPPFIGAKFMDDEQRLDSRAIFDKIDNAGLLDFVATWYVSSVRFIKKNHKIRCAFVSTNSITQGEQVGVLWGWMLSQGVKINFAHRTFVWSNEARGKAAVHCVIVGFGLEDYSQKIIYEYEDIKCEPHAIIAKNINPYLVDAPNTLLPRRNKPIFNSPEIGIGNKPIDGGYYLFNDEEKRKFIDQEPNSEKYFRKWVGAEEFLNNGVRWFLWLGKASPNELKSMPLVLKRIENVSLYRQGKIPNYKGKVQEKIPPASTIALANTPTKLHVEFIPDKPYMVIPEVSSERRLYIPMGYLPETTLASNKLRLLPNATLYHFGVLSSIMHMAWTRQTSGRLKSDFQYSINIVYNNFPWPNPNQKQIDEIENAAKTLLDIRDTFPNSSLADLYDPQTMPPSLFKAHKKLDKVVDSAYGFKSEASDASRIAFLFEMYQKQTNLKEITNDLKHKKNQKNLANT